MKKKDCLAPAEAKVEMSEHPEVVIICGEQRFCRGCKSLQGLNPDRVALAQRLEEIVSRATKANL